MYQFLSYEHEDRFNELCKKDKTHFNDFERKALFFIIAGNDMLFSEINLIYSFHERAINLEVYQKDFCTGSSRSLIELAFSLYGFGTCDVRNLFNCLDYQNSVLAIEALRTRFHILSYPERVRIS